MMTLPYTSNVKETPEIMCHKLLRTASSPHSCVSMKTDRSIELPQNLCLEDVVPVSRYKSECVGSPAHSCVSMESGRSMEKPYSLAGDVFPEGWQHFKTEAVHGPTVLRGSPDFCTLQEGSYPAVDDDLSKVLVTHKTNMRNKHRSLFEGIQVHGNKTALNAIYTQLYIVEGEGEGVNNEHEVLQMEKKPKPFHDTPINCLEIFNHVHDSIEENEPRVQKVRTVLTKGIAGIGKTVSVQKFILDWAEGKANQDVHFIFMLPFRELNLIKDDVSSLHKLLCDFHPELQALDAHMYRAFKIVFIFDGLDESRLRLDFLNATKVSDVTTTSSVSTLISNLINGHLLSSALIWITSRPAASNQIPRMYVDRVTEIQGFSDAQKEEYFRKRFSEQDQAKKFLSQIKRSRSLYIMCHIPVFCWILATVFQQIMKRNDGTEVPKTLTEIYAHFLLIQTNRRNEKYEKLDESDPEKLLETDRAMILKLAELAFKQLMKGHVMFYEEDLRDCGIELTEALVNSGICTEIFKEECVLYQKKVYCFVHLSFQEFFAAVYVFYCYITKRMELLRDTPLYKECSEDVPLDEVLKATVDEALRTDNGHLDLFLRFLLGISLEANHTILRVLLTGTPSSPEYLKNTVHYIKWQIQTEDLPTDRAINLFLCLTEMKDQSLLKEIQNFVKTEKQSEKKLSAAHCSAIAYILQVSDDVLEELDVKKYNATEDGRRRLIPAVSNCRRAQLEGCYLSTSSCESLRLALQLEMSPLRELNLSNNDLQDSGVKLLCDGLKSFHCNLEILRLALCNLGEKACEYLGSVLLLPHSSLRELDLSNNDMQDSGVKLLSDGLRSSCCKLESLRLSGCLIAGEGCTALASALISNPSHLRELDLRYNHPGDSGIELLNARLNDPDCNLETLRVEHAGEIRLTPGLRKYACEVTLDPNTAHTRLALSEGNRKVTHVTEEQPYPEHPERFDYWKQVMCTEGLCGRCYWEAEWPGGEAVVSMSYKGIRRKGGRGDCVFGSSENSWKLDCSTNSHTAWHNKKRTDVPALPSCSNRVGVYLDWQEGSLSFYSVSTEAGTCTHLHTYLTTFTEPLYAGFWVDCGSYVRIF